MKWVVYIWYKAQVRYFLGSDVMKPCITLYDWKELQETRVVWNRAEETKSSLTTRWRCLWRASSDDCSSFCFIIQHFQLCKSQVSDHTHPYEIFWLWHDKRQGWCCFQQCQKSHENSFLPGPSYYQTWSEMRYIWGRGGRCWVKHKWSKLSFQTSNLFSVPIMNEDWSWLLFYWLKKGMMGETHSGKDVRFLQRCSGMIDSYHWDLEG